MTPTTLHRVMVHDFRDALDDFTGDVPPNPEDYTLQAVTTLLGHLAACESYLLMLRYQAERIERCGATECSDAADAAANALAQPTLRERLGRAPLASEGVRGVTTTSGGMDRWNDFCAAVTQLEIHAVPYSVPDAKNTEWIGGLMRGLDAAWAAFALGTGVLRGMQNDIGPAGWEAAE